MLTLESLKEYGADVPQGMARCMNNEAFYLKMVKMAVADTQGRSRLEKALAEDDVKGAFEAAHAMKGVYANLALTPVLAPVEEMTEIFRAGSTAGTEELLKRFQEQSDALQALAAE